jgi:hypothetical protein
MCLSHVSLAGSMSISSRAIEYLTEENRVLREQIGDRRLRFSDDQRRRLAVCAKHLSRSALYADRHHRGYQLSPIRGEFSPNDVFDLGRIEQDSTGATNSL